MSAAAGWVRFALAITVDGRPFARGAVVPVDVIPPGCLVSMLRQRQVAAAEPGPIDRLRWWLFKGLV